MRPRIDANGETWEVGLDTHEAHPGLRALVFHCVTNSSWHWRVAEVPADEFASQDEVADAPKKRLLELFAQADPLGVAHEPGADPFHPGGHGSLAAPGTPEQIRTTDPDREPKDVR